MNRDYKYIQFIRNPQDDGKADSTKISYVALDYFDYIYVKDADNLKDCILAENKIPCEAYQSIFLFNDNVEKEEHMPCDGNLIEGDPFDDSHHSERPFLALLQVTRTPNTYANEDKRNESDYLGECEKELKDCLFNTVTKYCVSDEDLQVIYRIYKSVNTMDFCIVLSCNVLELSLLVSENIHTIFIECNEMKQAKYMVYTVMAIHKDFKSDHAGIIQNDSALIARLKLNRNFWGCRETREGKTVNISDVFKEKIKNSNTHFLVGRYDLSMRVDMSKDDPRNVKLLLEKLIYYKMHHELSESLMKDDKKTDELADWLLANKYVDYCNERILIAKSQGIPFYLYNEDIDCNNVEIFKESKQQVDKTEIKSAYDGLRREINECELNRYMDEYLRKLHEIILICDGLYSNYDTQINIIMLKGYILSLIDLLRLWCNMLKEKREKWNDIIINMTESLNYLQQFIKIVTSINSSSFQSPVYDIVQKECSIAKFPIAYSQFLNMVLKKYYFHRQAIKSKLDDKEFDYFPKYRALMIPFMQKVESDFFMQTLFAQGISSDWQKEKTEWKTFNETHTKPIFVVCKSLEYYIDVPTVIISSFHELGHYCNSTTRSMRNKLLIDICALMLAKDIVLEYCTKRSIMISVQQQMIERNEQIQKMKEIFADCLKEKILSKLEDKLDIPSIEFKKSLFLVMEQLLNPKPPYISAETAEKNYMNYCERNFKFQFSNDAYCHGGKQGVNQKKDHKQYLQETFTWAYNIIKEKKEHIENNLIGIEEDKRMRELLSAIEQFAKEAAENLDGFLNFDPLKSPADDHMECLHKTIESRFKNLDIHCNKKIKNEIRQCINIVNFITTSADEWVLMQRYVDDQMPEVEWVGPEEKEEWINQICERIKATIFDIDMPFISELETDLRNKLFLTNDKTITKMKEDIFDACRRIKIKTEMFDVWIQTYSESLADIVMCKNLNLSVSQYIIEKFRRKKHIDKFYVRRVILVINFLIYLEKGEKERLSSEGTIKEIEKLNKEGIFKRLGNGEEVRQMLRRSCDIVDDSCYVKILKSFIDNKDNYFFVEDEIDQEIDFVHLFLDNYSSDENAMSDEVKNVLENKKMEFIMRYYYQNRIEYAKMKPKTIMVKGEETEDVGK